MGYLSAFMSDPKAMLIMLLLAFPGRILAISCHEFAHAWVADRCGDHTARNMGRLTINPFRHLDLLGAIMMVVIGFGWAKPVPVNPRNYRNYRKDDLKVSVAGIAANFILFVLGFILLNVFMLLALSRLQGSGAVQIMQYAKEKVVVTGGYWYSVKNILQCVASQQVAEMFITTAFGRFGYYIYMMLVYFVEVNIVLAIFNLIPVPPLDGYHVLNDTILRRRRLFASPRAAQIAMMVMLALLFTGVLGQGLSFVINWIYQGLGSLNTALFGAIGLL